MTNMELLDILGDVQGKYILEAQQLRAGSKKPQRQRYIRQLAAAITLILILTVFLNTAPGVAAVECVKEKVTSLIEALFPPKKMTINVEGIEYEGDYAAVWNRKLLLKHRNLDLQFTMMLTAIRW